MSGPIEDLPGDKKKGNNLRKLGAAVDGLIPFASNIANAFTKPPAVPRPTLLPYRSLRKLDFSDERNAVNRAGASADAATERNMPENTAEAVKAFNRGQTFQKVSSINEREKNANTAINNQQVGIDSRIDEINARKEDDFKDSQVARTIAKQTQRSANLSNAADKVIGIRNEKEKNRVDLEKTRTLAQMYKRSGVTTRARIDMKKAGIQDPLGLDYEDVTEEEERMKKYDKKAYGGELSPGDKLARRGVTGSPIKRIPMTGAIDNRSRDGYGYPVPTRQQFASDPEFYGQAPSDTILSKYSSMTGNGTGQPVPNSPYGKMLNNLNYMKTNNWQDSNVYRPENMHIAANYDVIKAKLNRTIARFGGQLRKIS